MTNPSLDDGIGAGLTRRLAQEALVFPDDAIPEDVKEIARHCLLDWFSVALAAWSHPSVQAVMAWIEREPGNGQASLLGTGKRVSVSQAALVNGTASHVLDFDDAHLPSRVHPSVPLWSALLALAETKSLSGARALSAFAAGVQVQSRLAAVMGESHYRQGWHNTATLGSFGATAAIARLELLSQAQLGAAFGFAATLSGGMRSVFGSGAKPLHAGRAAANGLMAAGLAGAGLEGPGDILERAGGYVSVYACDSKPAALMEHAYPWEVRRIVFKYHSSCYGTQAPIEAAKMACDKMDASALESIRVHVEPQYLTVCNIAAPRTASEVKFSIAHMVALALAGRDTSNESSLMGAALEDAAVIGLRNRIEVLGDSGLARANARVELLDRSGQHAEAVCDASRPQDDLAFQRRRLREKSSALLTPLYGTAAVERLQERLLSFDSEPDLGAWIRPLLGELAQARRQQHQAE